MRKMSFKIKYEDLSIIIKLKLFINNKKFSYHIFFFGSKIVIKTFTI